MEAVRERPARPAPPRTSPQRPYPSAPPERSSSPGPGVTLNTEEKAKRIKQLHDKAFVFIEQGLSCDEHGQTEQAVTLYTSGLRCIDKALDIQGVPSESVQNMIAKMRKSKAQIQTRVETLLQSDAAAARAVDDPPPSYEDATTPTSSDFDMALSESIMNDEINGASGSLVANAQELFKIDDGVQIFHISSEGYVSAPSYPSSLGIYKLYQQNSGDTPPAFLKVGDWSYPLVPGSSPVLRSSYGAYIFPDLNSTDPGSAVGLIIPENISDVKKQELENKLNSLTAMQTQERRPSMERAAARSLAVPATPAAPRAAERPAPEKQALPGEEVLMVSPQTSVPLGPERTSTKISKGIVTAAEWITWGLGKGAEKAGELMKAGSAKLQTKLQPEGQPRQIDPRAQQGVHYARQATGVAVKVSGFLIKKLGDATVALGRKVGPHIRQQGEKFLPQSMKSSSRVGRSKIDDVVEVAAGGLKGWATVYIGLEQAARHLFRNIADETANVVHHKYGQEAGKFTENTLYSAGNAAQAAYNFTNLDVKAIAKRAAKDTGKAVVKDYVDERKKHQNGNHQNGNHQDGNNQDGNLGGPS